MASDFPGALLTLLGAHEDAHGAAIKFRGFIEARQSESQLAKNLLPVSRYMCGDRTESVEDLIAYSQTNREITAIAFKIGIEKLSRGKRSEAKRLFERVVEADFYPHPADTWSQRFLTRIHDPKWLPWLPNDHSLKQRNEVLRSSVPPIHM